MDQRALPRGHPGDDEGLGGMSSRRTGQPVGQGVGEGRDADRAVPQDGL